MQRVTHVAYDLVHRARTDLISVKDLDALRAALAALAGQGRRVTLRGAGLSLDAQALGRDVTLCLDPEGFGEIGPVRVSRGRATVRLGAMARWGDVYEAIAPQGYVTPNVVTGSAITVGGSLASDCLSRFSGAWGKEVEAVVSVEVMTADGALHTARPDAPEGSLARRLFEGVIGGFGALGVIVAATYRLRRVTSGRRPHARTEFDTFASADFTWEGFFARVRDETLAARRVVRARGAAAWRGPLPARVYDAVSATVWFRRLGPRGLLIRSRHVSGAGESTARIYQGVTGLRRNVEAALAWARFADVTQTINKLYCGLRSTSVDDLRGFSFFMDGNAAARDHVREAFGARLTSHQQTFVLPEAAAVAFAARAEAELRRARATIVDVLYLAADETPVLLSPTRGLGGFAITLGYQTLNGRRLAAARATLTRLSAACAALGGRVSLVKNVYADDAVLQGMYREGLDAMRALKREVDPEGRFGSLFLDRLLTAPRRTPRARPGAAGPRATPRRRA